VSWIVTVDLVVTVVIDMPYRDSAGDTEHQDVHTAIHVRSRKPMETGG
jgi:hypothetical protein